MTASGLRCRQGIFGFVARYEVFCEEFIGNNKTKYELFRKYFCVIAANEWHL